VEELVRTTPVGLDLQCCGVSETQRVISQQVFYFNEVDKIMEERLLK
jgi:hypothetical protein